MKREERHKFYERRYHELLKEREEQEDDNIEQRKLIERLNRLIKDRKHILPKEFMEKVYKIIEQYELRFTKVSESAKEKHPLYRDK